MVRLANRVLGALLSLAVIAAGGLLIVEIIAAQAGHPPVLAPWPAAYHWAQRTSWAQGSIRGACGVLIVLGLIVLIAELKPGRVTRLAAHPGEAATGDMDSGYTRRGVAAAVRTAAARVDGVRSASVTVRPRTVTVAATARGRDRAAARDLEAPVATAVRDRLAALRLHRQPAVRVRVRPRSR
jgi:hypothetical protein